MKKYLIALSAFTIMTAAANAQTKENSGADNQMRSHEQIKHKKVGHGKHHHNMGMMLKQINLSDEQKASAKSIRTDYHNQLKQLEQDKGITLQDYQSKKAALQHGQREKFEALLTPEQKSKMQEIKKEEMAKREELEQKRMDKMKASLNLTDDQVAKLQSEHQNFKTQAKAIREDKSLTVDQKKEQFMDLRKQMKENEKNIFTAEQLQKREELRKSKMNEMKNRKTERS